ncbi:mucin-3B isoform X1 [Oryzias melastigma]|uniref:mucin-3B isoform X1 n=1 Tax=Oryzias melastigma TaxID=30732 RepID=UPI00168CD40C|nr:mucin-3B isoform X1 [Oryzias melastigma]
MTTGSDTSGDSPATAPVTAETSPSSEGTPGPTEGSTPSNTEGTDPVTSAITGVTSQTHFTTDAVSGPPETAVTGMATDAGTSGDSPATVPITAETSPSSEGTPGPTESNTGGTTDPVTSVITGVTSQTPLTTDAGPSETSGITTDDTATTSGTAGTTVLSLSTSLTEAPIVTQKLCQNGGTLTGSVCVCLPQFNGTECQDFVAETTPGLIKRPVKVQMVLEEKFNDKYNDKTSEEYKEFVKNFTEKMDKYYKSKLSQPFEIVVTDVRRGGTLKKRPDSTVKKIKISLRETPQDYSVNVTHDVVLQLSNQGNQEKYEEEFKAIKNATEELKNCEDCGLTVSATEVETAEIDLAEQCQPIYEGHVVNDLIVCLSACHLNHSNHKVCFNDGECKVLVEPVCQCKNIDTFWYLRDDCSQPLHRIGLIAGVSVVLAVLLLFVAGLTAFSVFNKRKQTKTKDQKKKQVNLYMEEEVEWPRPNSPAGSNKAGYNNPSYLDDNSGYAKRQTPPYRNSPPPSYFGSRPMTLSDGPTPMPQTGQWPANSGYSRPASSDQNQGDIPLNQLMRIRRPQVRSSWDA